MSFERAMCLLEKAIDCEMNDSPANQLGIPNHYHDINLKIGLVIAELQKIQKSNKEAVTIFEAALYVNDLTLMNVNDTAANTDPKVVSPSKKRRYSH